MTASSTTATADATEVDRQRLLSDCALAVFGLNGQFLALAEGLARPVGLTAARWQVLGAVLREPLPVAGVARAMGLSRQAVQRIADLLVERGLAEYRTNPAHRRAKLLAATPAGLDAVHRIDPAHREAAGRLVDTLGEEDAVRVRDALLVLADAMARALDDPEDGRQ